MRYLTLTLPCDALLEALSTPREPQREDEEALRALCLRAAAHLRARVEPAQPLSWGGSARVATLRLETDARRWCFEAEVRPGAPLWLRLHVGESPPRTLDWEPGEGEGEGALERWLEEGWRGAGWPSPRWGEGAAWDAALCLERGHELPAPPPCWEEGAAADAVVAGARGWSPPAEAVQRRSSQARQQVVAAVVVAALGLTAHLWTSLGALWAVAGVAGAVWLLARKPRPLRAVAAPGAQQRLVFANQGLTWAGGVSHINLRRAFAVSLTRTPGPTAAATTLVQVALSQAGDGQAAVARLTFAVPALLNDEVAALPELMTQAPVLHPHEVSSWVWPALRYAASIHGHGLPWEARRAVPLHSPIGKQG